MAVGFGSLRHSGVFHFGVLNLIEDGYSLSRLEERPQMALKGIVREGGHGNVVALPHGQAEKCGNRLCILVEQLVFVSYSKEKQHVGMGLFGGVILLNRRHGFPWFSIVQRHRQCYPTGFVGN